ncbi:hypothetical protein C8J44_2399 [Sphingomonas sp. PP-CE-3A-406]|nr:hypothetical protein C8J47_0142 [Sphingomonas sp. PP-F2F-G114-C0414]RMB54771.1 hypothetical protein C8J44_2399 [Sphingomonas sp. PP-CE-3A-406]
MMSATLSSRTFFPAVADVIDMESRVSRGLLAYY